MTSAPSPGGPSWQQEPAASHPAGHPASSSFFRWIRGLDITRTPDRWVGGVAGGVARRTGLDLALVRGLIVVLAVFGGIGVLLYGLAWALLPEPDGRIHVEQAGRGSWTSGLTGAAVLVAIGLWRPNLSVHDGGGGGLLWTLFWIGAVVLFVYWIVSRSGRGGARPGDPDGGPAAPGSGPDSSRPPMPPFGPVPYGPAEPPAPASGPSDAFPGPGATPAPAGQDPSLPDAPPQSSTTTHPLPYQPASWAEWSAYPAADPGGSRVAGPESVGPPNLRHPRPSGSATALLLGGATITAAALLALDYAGVLDVGNAAAVALAAAAVVLALGIIALGMRGRSSGLVGVTAVLATIGALTASFTIGGGSWVVAEETTTTPASLQVASDGYSVLAAHATIDLADLPAPTRDVVVPVNSLASAVTVIVPADVPVEVRTRMALGRAGTVGPVGAVGAVGSVGTDTPSPALQGDGGVLQFGSGELNPEAGGAGLILDVRGAMSDVTILTTADGTFTPPGNGTTPTGDTP